MNRHQPNGLAYYTFPSLEGFSELVHGITTRHGGVSAAPFHSLNLTRSVGDEPAAVEENLHRVATAFGIRRDDLVSPSQRHTANVQRVGPGDRGSACESCDTLITSSPGVPVLLRFADCTPILIYDPTLRAFAVVHSGWRGTVKGAARAAVEALAEHYGSRPADLVAAIGPSIGPCCYEVGDDVTEAVDTAFGSGHDLATPGPAGRAHFDLWAANRRWLEQSGVRQIEVAGLCTACRVDEFYSHRRERTPHGHFGAVMCLKPL
jgi:YfiH family protein